MRHFQPEIGDHVPEVVDGADRRIPAAEDAPFGSTLLKVALAYLAVSVALALLLGEDSLNTLLTVMAAINSLGMLIGRNVLKILPVLLVALWWFGRGRSVAQIRAAFIVAIASVCLQVGFLFAKSAIPQLVPFYADPFFARIDKALFFGHDAWAVAHAVTGDALSAWFPLLYLTAWSTLAYGFPILVAASDTDASRSRRYLWLFFLSWIVIGNGLAVVGSSVGPVFYDRLLGVDRFAALHAALAQSGFAADQIGQLQERLWYYSNLGGTELSYISAFPSVHVAVATVVGMYLGERFRWLWPVGAAFAGVILLISVYSGYHYAVDGIASIAVVWGLNAVLRRDRRDFWQRQRAHIPVAEAAGS